MSAIPPAVFDFIASLPDPVQEKLIAVAGKAAMDPWFLALASIPALWQLAYAPHFVRVVILAIAQGPKYNNQTPRTTDIEKAAPQGFAPLVKRCAGCHDNMLEFLSFYAPAVLIAKMQKADGAHVRALAGRIVALRLIYMLVYVGGGNDIMAAVRTMVWLSTMVNTARIYAAGLGL